MLSSFFTKIDLTIRKIQLYHLMMGFILYLLFIRLILVFSYSIDLDGTEFGFIHNAQLLYRGLSIYRDPDAFPFYAVIYHPLYYYLLFWISKLANINPVYEVHLLLIVARSINLVLIFVCLWMLYSLMRQFNLSRNYIFLLLVCFLLLITGHFYVTRPDGIKITLFIAQLYAILRYFYFDVKYKRYLLLIMACNAISFLLKQDSFFYFNLILLLLILSKRDKESSYLLFACLLLTAICYSVTLLLFGKPFFTSTFLYNFQSITDIRNSYNIIIIYASVIRLSLLLMMCLYGAWIFRKNILVNSMEFLLGLSAVILFFIAHLFMLKSGAYINYSFELIVVLILLAAKLLAGYTATYTVKKSVKTIIFIYFVFLVFTNKPLTNYTLKKELTHAYKADYTEHFLTSAELKKIIKDDVFFLPNSSNLVYFSDYKNTFYGHDVHIDRFINLYLHIKETSRLLFVSSEKVDHCFMNGTVKYIVIETNPYSEEHVSKYYPNYSYFTSVRKFTVYKFTPNIN